MTVYIQEHGLYGHNQVLQWDGRASWWTGDTRDSQRYGQSDETHCDGYLNQHVDI